MVAEEVVGKMSFLLCFSTLTSAKLDIKDDMEVDMDMVAVVMEVVKNTVEVGTIMDMVGGVEMGVEINGKEFFACIILSIHCDHASFPLPGYIHPLLLTASNIPHIVYIPTFFRSVY